MELAGRYAYAGREWVVARVLRILGRGRDRPRAQPPQLRLARGARRRDAVGGPQGRHAGLAGAARVRGRLDGRRRGDRGGQGERAVEGGALLDRARRGARHVALGRRGAVRQAVALPRLPQLRRPAAAGHPQAGARRQPALSPVRRARRSAAAPASATPHARASTGTPRLPPCARSGSSCAAAPPTRRPAPTSALRTCSPTTATPSTSSTACTPSA